VASGWSPSSSPGSSAIGDVAALRRAPPPYVRAQDTSASHPTPDKSAPSWQGESSRRRLGQNAVAQVGCPDRRIDRLCITCCSPSQPSHHAMVLGAISSDPQRGWIIISLAPGHHCPGHSGELVRKRDSGDFGRPPCQQRCDPWPILGAVDLGIANDGRCPGHEQAAQIAIPLLILPSLSRPPLECCLGTSPIQAEKLRPDRKVLGSATLAARAVASSGPTPGMQLSACSFDWNGAM
jgi:hypothetical protein